MQLGLIIMCLAAGAAVPMQAAMNASVSARVSGGPLVAVAANFIVAAALLTATLLALRTPVPSPSQLSAVPWWGWLAGACGISVVFSLLYASPRLGATLAIAAVVTGQLVMSLLCDTFGWLNYQPQALTPGRIAGAALLVAGVVMIRKF